MSVLDVVEGGEEAARLVEVVVLGGRVAATLGPEELEVAGGVVRETEGSSGEYVKDNDKLNVEVAEGGVEVGPQSSTHARPTKLT